ncbi:uncharacterized protein LOC111688976 [Lucilia cuprina]|uniref:uncharacterized protein LOC111688976 n=1 Tax=Lucilia cuprina TaxID=7375 RepID=UPI001F058CDE|nr:uncharacterized protein LOC111688976 [Lucilia cuprina]
MLQAIKFLIIIVVIGLLTFRGVSGAPQAISTQSEILQSKELKKHLEVLKIHLEDAIQKLNHNIKARQAEFQAEIQTPDSEYIEAALGMQRKDFISAAAIPQIPLPAQTMRINQNSGLRR